MKIFCALAACAALNLAPAAAPASSRNPPAIDARPQGITPVALTLKEVLAAHDRSLGAPVAGTQARERSWTISALGLSGSSTEVSDRADERLTIRLGPFTQARGTDGGRSWRQNENGLTVFETGLHQRDSIDDRALDQAARTGTASGVTLLGEVKSPVDAYVVEVDPPGGRREWLFFDVASGRLLRKEAVVVDRRVITTFDDFRTTEGLTQAWHYRIDDGRPENLEDWRQTSERGAATIAAGEFTPPAGKSLVEFPPAQSAMRLPVRIVNGKIVVRVDVAGRGLDLLLDSGASSIVFDEEIVKSLGLATYGRSIQSTAGSYQESNALVPVMRIGGLTMRSVAISSLPFESHPTNGTMIVGLLGFDFLDGVVLRIDYENNTVDAYPDAQPPPLPSNAVELTAALDDGVPDIRASIAGVTADHFILDTGATSGVIFSAFADAHAEAVADRGLGTQLLREHPFQFAGGVGGTLHVEPTQVRSFGISGKEFDDFLAYVVRGNRSYEGEDEDGLLGYDYLKYFTVYLDYGRARIALVRNGVPYRPLAIGSEPLFP